MRTLLAMATALAAVAAPPASAQNHLLSDAVDFTAMVLYYEYKVPAVVVGAVREGEIAVAGWGEHQDGSDTPPDGDTLMTIGSITKAFTGTTLASLVADGTVRLTDR